MTSTISSETLTKLCAILTEERRPASSRTELTRFERELLSLGVATNLDLCDFLITTEARAWSSIEHFVEELFDEFAIPQLYLYRRPEDPRDEVSNRPGLSAIDITALLIGLESLGLQVDPSRLVQRLSPALKAKSVLTNSEFEVDMYAHYVGKRRVRLQAARDGGVSQLRETSHTDAAGYRFVMLWQGEVVVSLEVQGPQYQVPEPQVSVKCDYCGHEYLTNNTEEERMHLDVHSRHQKLFDPEPDQRFSGQLASHADGERVNHESPLWMHGEIYERAAAFRREFGYDFVQWAGSWSQHAGEDWEGRLFALGDDGTVAGACAFMRPDLNSQEPGWALQWIWFAPKYRRSGLLESRWSSLVETYGDFYIEPPLSPAMQSFVRKHGTEKQKAALTTGVHR